MMVGEMPAVASARSTCSPETELNATDAFTYSAARIMQRGYERARESMERTRSEDVRCWPRGSTEPKPAIPATKACHDKLG